MGSMENLKSLVLDGNPLRSLRRDVVMVSCKHTFSSYMYLNKKPQGQTETQATCSSFRINQLKFKILPLTAYYVDVLQWLPQEVS